MVKMEDVLETYEHAYDPQQPVAKSGSSRGNVWVIEESRTLRLCVGKRRPEPYES
jgi:hypothetical protein